MKKYLLILVVLFTIPVFAQLTVTAGVDGFTKLLPVNDFSLSEYNIGGTVGVLSHGGGSFYYGFTTGYYTDRADFKAIPTVIKFRVGNGLLTEINTGVWWVTGFGKILGDVGSIKDFKPVFNLDLLVGVKPFKDLPARILVGGRLLEDEIYAVVNLAY